MSIRLKYSLPVCLQLSAAVLVTAPCFAATWKTGVAYGGTGPTMDLYVPDRVDASPGIVVALHYCSGTAAGIHSWFQSLADQYGFIIIAPDASGNCWDASPGRSAEKAAIVQMVQYVITQNKADKTKVFAAGASSGACMTNTLLGVYPDVFAAGSVLAGVPVGAWPSGTECSICSGTPATKTAAAWGDIVRNAYSFTGTRPRVQLWHGTADDTLKYPFLAEEVKQWTNVLGLSGSGTAGTGPTGWERTSYADASGTVMLEVNIGQGKPHDLTSVQPALWPDVIRFFGLDKDSPGTGGAGGAGGTSSGGASAVGGTTSKGGTSSATGGTATAAGGAVAKGGTSSAVGGTTAKGGAASAAGGSSSKGGATASIGGTSTGGAVSTGKGGGTTATGEGGATAKGGTSSTTASNTGGSTNAASGSGGTGATTSTTSTPASGGATPISSTGTPLPADAGGCSCSVPGNGRAGEGAFAALVALAFGLTMRRRQRQG